VLHNILIGKCPRGTLRSRWEQQVRKNVTEKGGRMKVGEIVEEGKQEL
jgi:hypothetical protein